MSLDIRYTHGTNPGFYNWFLDVGNKTYGTTNLNVGAKYYIAVKSYSNIFESAYSSEISYTVPGSISYTSNTIVTISLDLLQSTDFTNWNVFKSNWGTLTLTNPPSNYNYRGLMHISSTNQ
jgi:hypothetical protein